MRVISVEQMRELERLTFAAGTSEDELQRRAGTAVAEAIHRLRPEASSVVALVGPGNNGRDAWIAADTLRTLGWWATLYLTPRHAITADELRAFTRAGGLVVHQEDGGGAGLDILLATSGVIIDGLLGIGGKGPLREPLAEVAEALNEAHSGNEGLLVVAVDAPSGVDADTGEAPGLAIKADATVVLGGAKRGLLTVAAAHYAGRLIFADIGIVDAYPDAPEMLTLDRVRGVLPTPPADAHKGIFGRLLVVAGSERYIGAAYLVCAAAIRSGAGIVTLAAPRWLRDVIGSRLAEVTYLTLPDGGPAGDPGESAERISSEIEGFSALALGPGLSTDGGVVQFVEAVLRDSATRKLPTILDADGLNALARISGWESWIGDDLVATPHVGELRRLAPDVNLGTAPWETVARLSSSWPGTLVLKGPFTSIGHRGRAWVHALPNPALATGGTGDVLTGIVAGLLARGLPPDQAALLGVWVHGRAGSLAAAGRAAGGVMASDLLAEISGALAATLQSRPRLEPAMPL